MWVWLSQKAGITIPPSASITSALPAIRLTSLQPKAAILPSRMSSQALCRDSTSDIASPHLRVTPWGTIPISSPMFLIRQVRILKIQVFLVADKLYRLNHKRMHIGIGLYEGNYFAVVFEDLFNGGG